MGNKNRSWQTYAVRGAALSCAALLLACKGDSSTAPQNTQPERTFRMGFSAFPPRADNDVLLASLDLWTRRADAAIMHVSVPYKDILAGITADSFVKVVDLPLANYFRAKNLPVTVTLDVTDGLNRSAESPDLVSIGRSITEPAVQQVYRQYVRAIVTNIRPSYLGLAAETNLIRDVAPAPLYAAVVQMTNDAAADVRGLSGTLPQLYVSVQADDAWGVLLQGGTYQGVERDFTDFPFMQALGISSYPYFVYADPSQMPLDYYSRLKNGRAIPVMVVEGGWSSGAVGSVQSSADKQSRYLRRHEQILDSAKAIAVFQLNFTDIDISTMTLPPGSILPLFAQIGLVDTELRPKPALATYDSVFARRLRK